MKLEFYAAFNDGLILMVGDAFEVDGRLYVAHKGREPFDKEYRVSEVTTGFAVRIPRTRNKAEAIATAKKVLADMPLNVLVAVLKSAETFKKTLKIIAS